MNRESKTKNIFSLSSIFGRIGIFLPVILLLIAGCMVSDKFFTAGNFLNILNAIALLGIVSTGMAFVTHSGSMADLSIPSIMAFSGIITIAALPLGLFAAIVLGICAVAVEETGYIETGSFFKHSLSPVCVSGTGRGRRRR